MGDRSSRVEVLIELDVGPGDHDDELDRRTEQLGRRLRELDVEDVRRPLAQPAADGLAMPESGPAATPESAPAAEAETSSAGEPEADLADAQVAPPEAQVAPEAVPGVLVVQLAPVLPALHDVIHTVRVWLSNYPDRAATLAIDGDRIEVTGTPVEDERELVRSWTERHSPGEL